MRSPENDLIPSAGCRELLEECPAVTVHEITNEQSAQLPFHEYSRFKYGSRSIADRYGWELSHAVWHSGLRKILLEHAADGTKVIVYPPPFINIPTAGYFLTRSFFNSLNRQLFSVGCSPILFGKVWRKKSYFTDYSRLSKAERENVFADEVFTTDTELLRSAYALFVDDIRITGAHENRIFRMTDELGVARGQIAMLHYARIQIPDLDPAIEDRMNSAAMSNLTSVTEMINANDFCWNTRVTKHVLSQPAESFMEFAESIRSADRVRLLNGALSNGYGYLPEFQGNVQRLHSSLQ